MSRSGGRHTRLVSSLTRLLFGWAPSLYKFLLLFVEMFRALRGAFFCPYGPRCPTEAQ